MLFFRKATNHWEFDAACQSDGKAYNRARYGASLCMPRMGSLVHKLLALFRGDQVYYASGNTFLSVPSRLLTGRSYRHSHSPNGDCGVPGRSLPRIWLNRLGVNARVELLFIPTSPKHTTSFVDAQWSRYAHPFITGMVLGHLAETLMTVYKRLFTSMWRVLFGGVFGRWEWKIRVFTPLFDVWAELAVTR